MGNGILIPVKDYPGHKNLNNKALILLINFEGEFDLPLSTYLEEKEVKLTKKTQKGVLNEF